MEAVIASQGGCAVCAGITLRAAAPHACGRTVWPARGCTAWLASKQPARGRAHQATGASAAQHAAVASAQLHSVQQARGQAGRWQQLVGSEAGAGRNLDLARAAP